MGTSPPCPLPAAVFPKESVKGHEPAWVCRALGTACWEGQCRQDVRGHEPGYVGAGGKKRWWVW